MNYHNELLYFTAGCKGAAHKQDRHNCGVLVILKLFLSDVTTWNVQIKGQHVPIENSILWEPPQPSKQRIDQDLRDLIISYKDKASDEQILAMLEHKSQSLPVIMQKPMNKRWLKRIIYAMKCRWQKKNYNVTGEMPSGLLLDDELPSHPSQEVMAPQDTEGTSLTFLVGDNRTLCGARNNSEVTHDGHYEDIQVIHDFTGTLQSGPSEVDIQSGLQFSVDNIVIQAPKIEMTSSETLVSPQQGGATHVVVMETDNDASQSVLLQIQ